MSDRGRTCKNGIPGCAYPDEVLDLHLDAAGNTYRKLRIFCQCDVQHGRPACEKASSVLVKRVTDSEEVFLTPEQIYDSVKDRPSILDEQTSSSSKPVCERQCQVCAPYCNMLLDVELPGGTLRQAGIFCRKLAKEAQQKPRSAQPWFPQTDKQCQDVLSTPDSAGYPAKERGITSLDELLAGRSFMTLSEMLIEKRVADLIPPSNAYNQYILSWLDEQNKEMME